MEGVSCREIKDIVQVSAAPICESEENYRLLINIEDKIKKVYESLSGFCSFFFFFFLFLCVTAKLTLRLRGEITEPRTEPDTLSFFLFFLRVNFNIWKISFDNCGFDFCPKKNKNNIKS